MASETFCLGEGEGHGHLHVNRPRFVEYVVRAREAYRRRYEIVGRTDSEQHAYALLAETMRTQRRFFRGDVLGDEGPESYYDPTLLVEMRR